MKSRFVKAMTLVMALLLCAGALAEVRTTGNVWMRSEPNLRGEQITSYNENTTLDYLDATSVDERGVAWYKVTDGKNTGWVSSRYSELLNEESVPVDGGNDAAAENGAEAAPVEADAGDDADVDGEGDNWFTGDEGDALELSEYYHGDLLTAAYALALPEFRADMNSEVPYQYYNDAVTIAGTQLVDSISITGKGYAVYGVSVGTPADEAESLMAAAGLDFQDNGSIYGMTFLHRGQEDSTYVDETGHDSSINLELANGVVAEIDWSTFTG